MAADPTDVVIAQLCIMTFYRFLQERNIGREAETVPLLKEAWNQAILSATHLQTQSDDTGFGLLVK